MAIYSHISNLSKYSIFKMLKDNQYESAIRETEKGSLSTISKTILKHHPIEEE